MCVTLFKFASSESSLTYFGKVCSSTDGRNCFGAAWLSEYNYSVTSNILICWRRRTFENKDTTPTYETDK